MQLHCCHAVARTPTPARPPPLRNSTVWISQHATGQAIDITAFRLTDGRRIAVEDTWSAQTAAGQFLRAVHQGACRLFKVALGPDYDALHRNHFHLDVGWMVRCR